jgi:hypothetical protein
VHKDVSFVPLHLCAAVNRRCFKYIPFAVSSATFMNNFNVHLIWSYVNKTFIRSITCCTPLQHPISEEVFVHSKFYIVCFFYYPKHCISYGAPWQMQGFYAITPLCLGKKIKEMLCLLPSLFRCFCRHRLVHGSLHVYEARCKRQEYLWQDNTKKDQITWEILFTEMESW